jgi:glycosyltransferase involved in cell wall biosynthesis
LRIGIYLADLNRRSNDSHGIITYSIGLVETIKSILEPGDRLIVYTSKSIYPEVSKLGADIRVSYTPRNMVTRLFKDHFLATIWMARDKLDVMHFPKGMIPVTRRFSKAKIIATVHDDIPKAYLDGRFDYESSRFKLRFVVACFRFSLQKADHILTDSDFSAERLSKFVPASTPKLVVAPVGLEVRGDRTTPVFERKNEAIIFASQLPHKRTEATLRAVAPELHRRGIKLVGVGQPSIGAELIDEWLPSPVPQQELTRRIASARVLVFGSIYEGFGLPPLEAWALGTPALVARARPMEDHLGGCPGLFTPSIASSVSEALEDLLALDDVSIERWRLYISEAFTWERTANALIDLYGLQRTPNESRTD